MSKKIKDFRARQQVKEEQINFLLSGVEKNLEEYEIAIEIKDKQLSDAKKISVSAKQSYDKTAAENKELKAYIENLKQHLQQQQQQQVQFLEKQKKNTIDIKNHLQKNIKKLYIKEKVIQVKVNLKKKKKKNLKTIK